MFIDWLNYYIIAKHNGMAPIKAWVPELVMRVETIHYSTLFPFWPVEVFSGAGGRAYSVWWSGVRWVFIYLELQCDMAKCIYGGEEETLDQTWRWISDSLLAYRLKIPPAINRALHYTRYRILWCKPTSPCIRKPRTLQFSYIPHRMRTTAMSLVVNTRTLLHTVLNAYLI